MPSRISIVSLSAGGSTLMAWNRRSSDRSFSMYLRYSAGVVAPMQRISPRESAGLRMLAASSEPSADPAPTSVCSSSMNTMMFWFSTSSFMIALSRSSNCPRYLVPATISEMSSARIRLSARKCGTSPNTIFWASPSTIAVLPTPGSPISTALFLVRRHSTCCTRSTRSSRPTSGSSWFFIAASVRSRLNSASSGVSFTRVSVVFSLSNWTTSSRTVEAHPLFEENGGRHRALLAEDAEQQVLGANVVVEQPVRFLGGVLQYPLGLGTERDLHRSGDLLAEDRAALDLLANAFERQVGARENATREALAFTDQPEQQMLRLDRNAPELARLVAGEKEYSPWLVRYTARTSDCRKSKKSRDFEELDRPR
jgi:hypothetical protein